MALALFILEDRCSFSDRASQNFLGYPPLSVRILSGWSGPLTVAVPVLYYVLSEVGMPKIFGCCIKGLPLRTKKVMGTAINTNGN